MRCFCLKDKWGKDNSKQRNQYEQEHAGVKLLLGAGASDKRCPFQTWLYIMYFPGAGFGWSHREIETLNHSELKKEKAPEFGIMINRLILLGLI